MSKMTQQWKYGEKFFCASKDSHLTIPFLKNEARTQKYFLNMALEKKSVATPGI